MMQAAQAGAIVPPADVRYVKLGVPRHGGDPVVGKVVSFLQSLYESVAETLPDLRSLPASDACQTVLSMEQEEDPYRAMMEAEDASSSSIKPQKKSRAFKSVKLDPAVQVEQETRWLPPGGRMKDYWEQMCLQGTQVSFSQFWKAFRRNFKLTFFFCDELCAICCRNNSPCPSMFRTRALFS